MDVEHIGIEVADGLACKTAEAASVQEPAVLASDAAGEAGGRIFTTNPPYVTNAGVRRLTVLDKVHAGEPRVYSFSLADLEGTVEQARRITVPQVQDLHACRRLATPMIDLLDSRGSSSSHPRSRINSRRYTRNQTSRAAE